MNIYTETDRHLHHLSQIIAKANRSYVPSKEDDSHTNLYYDPIGNRIQGRWIEAKPSSVLFTLNLETQSFEILNSSLEVVENISSVSKTKATVENEMEKLLPNLGLNPEGFTAELHYEIPVYNFADEPIKMIKSEGLKLWKEYRELANDICFSLLGHGQAWEEVRIWPHHFDTGIYFKAKKDLGIGFGLAMEDSMAGAPYFYMSAYPEGYTIDYKNLPEGNWRWQVGEGWTGSLLTLTELENLQASEKKEAVVNYASSIYKWMIKK